MINTANFMALPVFERGVWLAARPWLDGMDPAQRADELQLRTAVLAQMGIGLEPTDDLITMLGAFHLDTEALAFAACEAFGDDMSDEPLRLAEKMTGLPDGVLDDVPVVVFSWFAEHVVAQLAEALRLPQPSWKAA